MRYLLLAVALSYAASPSYADEWADVDTGLPADPAGCARVVPPYSGARELDELLLDAVTRRCRMLARVLVKRGADAAYTVGGRSALSVATVAGDSGVLIDLLSTGSRATPELLHAAIEARMPATAELHVLYGADPRAQRPGENSELIHAAQRGLDETVFFMLYWNFHRYHLDANEELLEDGAPTGVNMIHLLAWSGPAKRPKFYDAFRAYMGKEGFANMPVSAAAAGRWAPYAGWTALDFAVDAGSEDAVEILKRYNVRSGRRP